MLRRRCHNRTCDARFVTKQSIAYNNIFIYLFVSLRVFNVKININSAYTSFCSTFHTQTDNNKYTRDANPCVVAQQHRQNKAPALCFAAAEMTRVLAACAIFRTQIGKSIIWKLVHGARFSYLFVLCPLLQIVLSICVLWWITTARICVFAPHNWKLMKNTHATSVCVKKTCSHFCLSRARTRLTIFSTTHTATKLKYM